MESEHDWVDVGAVEALEGRGPAAGDGAHDEARAHVPRRSLHGHLGRVQSRGRTAWRGQARRRLRGVPLALLGLHHATGEGEPGYEDDAVPAYAVKVDDGRVLVDMASATKRRKKPHAPHPLARTPKRERAPCACSASRPPR